MILTLEQAKAHLRVNAGDDDALITLYIGAAERAAADALNREIYVDQATMDAAEDTTGVVATDAIRAALLLTVGKLYAVREDVVVGQGVSTLPDGARALLWPYRVGLGA